MKSERIDLSVVMALGLACVCSASAPAQTCGWLPGEGIRGVDGTVYAVTTWDPDGAGPAERG